MSEPIPFQNRQAHILGQPFTLITCFVPVNMTLSCNCGGADTGVSVVGSISAACPSCGRTYNAAFNPTNGKMEMQIGIPPSEQKVPS